MNTTSIRISLLVTAREKARIARKARKAGLSVGAYIRRAAQLYRPADDNRPLEVAIGQLAEAAEQAERAVDNALQFIRASNLRIEQLERAARDRSKRNSVRDSYISRR